jgi:MtrB/PioB family decaheme-associated outer membrane protein
MTPASGHSGADRRPVAFRLTAIAVALLAAYGTARAQTQDREVSDSMHLDANALGVGLGYATSAGPRFGEYNGINEKGYYGVLDFNSVRRDEETGTWTRLFGRNIGLENFQLRAEQQRQGDWGYFIEYGRIPRFEPLTPVTGVTGIGTANLTVPTTPLTNGNHPLSTRRDALGLGFDKFLGGNWDLQVRFKNEEKDGARIFARGTTGTPAAPAVGFFEFTPEPINSTTQQLEAKLNYVDERLQMTGGYYGTLYSNHNTQLNIAGGNASLSSEFNPIALPPDNQSHQIYLTGGYGFTSTTRGTFKVAHAKQIQDDPFINVPVLPNIGPNLSGRVDTTLYQAGVTSRPIPKLTLLLDYRYEERDDKTPQLQYGTPGSTTDGTNDVRSVRRTNTKAEASYQLPESIRLTAGIGYDTTWRNTAPIRIVSYRETTDELSYKLELRRMMSETLTGAIAYIHSDRGGSPFQQTVQNTTPTQVGSNLIAPVNLADRKRDKVRLSANWMPTEPLSVQFYVDNAWDSYTDRDNSGLGVRRGTYQNYSIDASYAFTQDFQATAWYSINNTSIDQTTCESATANGACPASTADPVWNAALKSTSNNFGAGLRGKPHAKVDVGADLSYSEIKDKYDQSAVTAGAAIPAIPTITTKMTRVTVYGKYALDPRSGIRLDYVYDRFSSDDWTWQSFTFLDGTQLLEPSVQKVNFFLVSYYYKWR